MKKNEPSELLPATQVPIFVAANDLRRVAREAVFSSSSVAPGPVANFWSCVSTLTALVATALRATGDETELRRLREADFAIDVLRHDAYAMLKAGALAPRMFDEIMLASRRCQRELLARVAQTRRRVWARLCGAGSQTAPHGWRVASAGGSSDRPLE